jgi:hypothetical protein
LFLLYLVSISESEIQDLFRFGQPASHPAVGVNGFLKQNDLNRRRFQSPRFKTATEFGGDVP